MIQRQVTGLQENQMFCQITEISQPKGHSLEISIYFLHFVEYIFLAEIKLD